MSLQTLEQQIANEYGAIRAFVMLHPWAYSFTIAAGSAIITASIYRIFGVS